LGEKHQPQAEHDARPAYEIHTREDDEVVEAWLRRFRVLHLEGGKTSATFTAMLTLISRHVKANAEGKGVRDVLRGYKKLKRQSRRGTGFQLHIETVQITSGQALDDRLNGVYPAAPA
jgi:hypothetical protein